MANSNPGFLDGQTIHSNTWNGLFTGKVDEVNGSLTNPSIGGTTISGFGTAVGQALGPLINFQGSGVPALQLANSVIFDRKTPGPSDRTDMHFRRAATYTGGSSASINSSVTVEVSVGATSNSWEWAFLSKATTASTSGAGIVGGYIQAWRTAGLSNVIGIVSDTADFQGTQSSLSGAIVSVELDLSASDIDDGVNGGSFGGVGVRKMAHLVFAQPSSTVNSEYSSGIWFGTAVNGSAAAFVDSLLAVQGGSQSTRIRNFLDSRGAAAPIGVTDPVAAVRMSAGHIVDFKGGTALNSAPGNYLQWTTSPNRLRYMVGASEILSISDAGVISALNFGNRIASSPTDLSQHIQLYSPNYGLSVTAGQMNLVCAGSLSAFCTATGFSVGAALNFVTLPTSAANDAAAATAGIPVGGTYRTGSALMVRVV